MDHSKHIPLTQQELTEAVLTSAPIYGADDRKLGTISHVHGSGPTTQVVVDIGGFLGIGSKPALLSTDQLNLMRDENGEVHGKAAWTKEQLKELLEHRH